MHSLRIEGTLKPGKRDEFLKAWSSQVLPTLKKQNGFVDEILLFDESTHTGMGISIWKSRQDAEQYHRNTFNQLSGHVESLLTGKPTVRSCEILHSETLHVNLHKAA